MEIWEITMPVIALTILAVGAYMIWMITNAKKTGVPIEDERTIRINGRAFQIGFFVGTYYLIVLNFYNIAASEFLNGAPLESMPVINSALILMGISVLAARWYLMGKPDA
jgi:uncharacterized membrane protein